MTDKIIDLHTHSTASDGTEPPRMVARAAKDAGLCAAALTDHDTTDGVPDFLDECRKIGIEGIAGVEISAQHEKTMHIVGLFIDPCDEVLCDKLRKLRGGRKTRNARVLELLAQNGIDVTEDDIISQKEGASLSNTGRAHIAKAMVRKGYCADMDEVFDKYLKKGRPCYAKRLTYSPRESIEMIRAAGGRAILAHPNLISTDYDTLFPLIAELKEYGLDGMECYYNNYTAEFSRMCKDICEKLSLAQSGGSDFHGANKPSIMIGRVSEGTVPYSVLEGIKALP